MSEVRGTRRQVLFYSERSIIPSNVMPISTVNESEYMTYYSSTYTWSLMECVSLMSFARTLSSVLAKIGLLY